jgi:hypothetical protein
MSAEVDLAVLGKLDACNLDFDVRLALPSPFILSLCSLTLSPSGFLFCTLCRRVFVRRSITPCQAVLNSTLLNMPSNMHTFHSQLDFSTPEKNTR